ncbi:hypothetical protein [Sorangium sp. So ce1182]|uniref:hypothetical protein n=1 Tax=Sorangium sp. So ce1182 TaxID=3133334 RepID=UPI003F60DB58
MVRAFIASLTVSLLAGCAVTPAEEATEEDLVPADATAEQPASSAALIDTTVAEAEAEGAAVAYSSTVTFNAETPFYIPPRVGGDSDFSGNGPSVYLITGLHLVNGNEVWATVHIDAKETKSDWTQATGTGWFHLYTAPREITAIFAQPFMEHKYVDTDHDRDIFGFPAGYLVSRLEYVGDTKGNEAGSRTGVKVVFQPITVGLL